MGTEPEPGDHGETRMGWRLPADPAAGAIPPEPSGTAETHLRGPGADQTYARDPGADQTYARDPGAGETYARDPGADETYARNPGADQTYAREAAAGETSLRDPDTAATRIPGGGASPHPADGDVRRFGPGVTAAPQWTDAGAGQRPVRRGRSVRGGVLFALVVLAAVIAYLLFWRPDPLVLTGAEVAPAAPPGQGCDVTVDVVGTIHTNGESGTIHYRWLRSDGESSGPLTQTAEAGQPVVQVHLLWTLSGTGRYPASATLEISQPQPLTATGGFTYSCR
jgi:hypothetical protein